MKHHLRRIIPVLLFLVLATVAILYLRSLSKPAAGPLQASGSIEAITIRIAPEISGKVARVLVSEGETVTAGQVLVELDDTLLQSQLAQAQAALAAAQANLALVKAGKTPEQAAASQAAATLELTAARQARQSLDDQHSLALALANQELAAARQAVQDASQALADALLLDYQPQLEAARASLVLAQDQLDRAQETYDLNADRDPDDPRLAQASLALAQAQIAYDAAARQVRSLEGKTNAQEVALAEAALALAEARLANAEQTAADLALGPDPDALALAEARLANAQAQLALAQAPLPTPEQLAVAEAQVKTAESALATLQVQLSKTVLAAPAGGLVMDRLVEPGEIALPNAPLLTIAQVQNLSITIYLPEDRYGEILVGQKARVQVDSFPGQDFPATVTAIADRAEFTPRNVQTAEGRKATVFAVKLSLDPSGGRLKPGMPADVIFSTGN